MAALTSYDAYKERLKKDAARISILAQCSCGLRRPLSELYFCEACAALKCDECTAVEIDMYYCPQCFASAVPLVAAQDHYRCKQCCECPQCAHVLTLVCASGVVWTRRGRGRERQSVRMLCVGRHVLRTLNHVGDRLAF
jgi:hypothetical protein